MTRVELHQRHKRNTVYNPLDVDNIQIPRDIQIRGRLHFDWHEDFLAYSFDILKKINKQFFQNK